MAYFKEELKKVFYSFARICMSSLNKMLLPEIENT
ncbi:hypothetical protein AB751O23_AI_00140 [Chlamydiales bacterium SCGC AB-751-O23]|nr:hypothetical protein AB751O23_AI_00140 [Chlamydiales bacterium SCGC AB-751-O23]